MVGGSVQSGLTILCPDVRNLGPDHINRLYDMAADHAAGPFRFLCFEPGGDGLRPEIERLAPPALPAQAPFGDWNLLRAFAPGVSEELGETALLLDPEIMVVGQISAFLEPPGDFIMIRDWYHRFARIGNASVLRFRPVRLTDAYEQFCSDPDAITSRFRNAREYLSWYADHFGALSFWPKGWCVSFRRDCIPRWPLNHWRAPELPTGSRIVVFHGKPTMSEGLQGRRAAGGIRSHRPAPWVGKGV